MSATFDGNGSADDTFEDGEVRAMLETLERYAEDCDGEASGYLESVIDTLRAAFPAAPWDDIERLLERYEMDEAAELLRGVLAGV